MQIKFLHVIHALMEPEDELNSTLECLDWDLETVSIGAHNQKEIGLTPHERISQKKVKQSLKYTTESALYHGSIRDRTSNG